MVLLGLLLASITALLVLLLSLLPLLFLFTLRSCWVCFGVLLSIFIVLDTPNLVLFVSLARRVKAGLLLLTTRLLILLNFGIRLFGSLTHRSCRSDCLCVIIFSRGSSDYKIAIRISYIMILTLLAGQVEGRHLEANTLFLLFFRH